MGTNSNGLQDYNAYYIPAIDKMLIVQTRTPTSNFGYSYLLDESLSVHAEFLRKSSSSSASLVVPVATEDAIEPYLLLSSPNQSGVNYLFLAMWTPYLATINNLTSPITKSKEHTMKIVYSVYNS